MKNLAGRWFFTQLVNMDKNTQRLPRPLCELHSYTHHLMVITKELQLSETILDSDFFILFSNKIFSYKFSFDFIIFDKSIFHSLRLICLLIFSFIHVLPLSNHEGALAKSNQFSKSRYLSLPFRVLVKWESMWNEESHWFSPSFSVTMDNHCSTKPSSFLLPLFPFPYSSRVFLFFRYCFESFFTLKWSFAAVYFSSMMRNP